MSPNDNNKNSPGSDNASSDELITDDVQSGDSAHPKDDDTWFDVDEMDIDLEDFSHQKSSDSTHNAESNFDDVTTDTNTSLVPNTTASTDDADTLSSVEGHSDENYHADEPHTDMPTHELSSNEESIMSTEEHDNNTVEPIVEPSASEHIDPSAMSVGAWLSAEREKQHIGVDEAAKRLRLTPKEVQSMEQDDFSFAAPVFVRGYFKNYAKLLNLPPEEVESKYKAQSTGVAAGAASAKANAKSDDSSGAEHRSSPEKTTSPVAPASAPTKSASSSKGGGFPWETVVMIILVLLVLFYAYKFLPWNQWFGMNDDDTVGQDGMASGELLVPEEDEPNPLFAEDNAGNGGDDADNTDNVAANEGASDTAEPISPDETVAPVSDSTTAANDNGDAPVILDSGQGLGNILIENLLSDSQTITGLPEGGLPETSTDSTLLTGEEAAASSQSETTFVNTPSPSEEGDLSDVDAEIREAVEEGGVARNFTESDLGIAEASPAEREIELVMSDRSWIEVTQQDGTRLIYGIFEDGQIQTINSESPVDVVLGVPSAVTIRINGEPVDTSTYRSSSGVARFEL